MGRGGRGPVRAGWDGSERVRAGGLPGRRLSAQPILNVCIWAARGARSHVEVVLAQEYLPELNHVGVAQAAVVEGLMLDVRQGKVGALLRGGGAWGPCSLHRAGRPAPGGLRRAACAGRPAPGGLQAARQSTPWQAPGAAPAPSFSRRHAPPSACPLPAPPIQRRLQHRRGWPP
jgi:hypothetical protein